MASPELRRLWQLHLVDSALVEIRKRAAALDPGRALMAKLQKLEAELAEVGGHAKSLSGELADLELAQKGCADKIKKIEKELYGGKVVNPREVENLEKEIAALNRQRASHDNRILELWDLVPPAKEAAEKVEKEIAEVKKQLGEHRKAALATKERLEKEFQEKSAARPALVAEIDKPLLARYDAIRQKHEGIGMAEITKKRQCSGCGTSLPERTIQAAKEDRTVTCESCHRILYYTEGLV